MTDTQKYLRAIQTTLANDKPEGVRAVYVIGSAVTGAYLDGYSDIDLMIFAGDVDALALAEVFRGYVDKLAEISPHIHKPADTPPRNLIVRARILQEGRLLYGDDIRRRWPPADPAILRSQIAVDLDYQLISARLLLTDAPRLGAPHPRTLYYIRKLYLSAIRAAFLQIGLSIDAYDVLIFALESAILHGDEAAADLEQIAAWLRDGEMPGDMHALVVRLHTFLESLQARVHQQSSASAD